MSTITKKILRTIGVITGFVMVGIGALVLFIWISLGDSSIEKMPFEKDLWLNGTNESQMLFPRQGMADYMIEERTLYGMGKREVLEMLGEPEMDNIQWNEKESFALIYKLGPERGFMSVDSEWLAIRFGKDGKVSQYRLITD